MFRVVLSVLVLSHWSSCIATARAADASQRNVLLIVADDLGLQLGCYGERLVKTPNVDRLAREGTRFTRAFCSASSCSPSRAEILTGLYCHCMLSYGTEHDWNEAVTYDSVLTLPARLEMAGYRTCSIGKHTLVPERLYHFQVYGNPGGAVEGGTRNGVEIAHSAREFMAQDPARPFFLYVGLRDPHRGGGPSDSTKFANATNYPGCTPVMYDPAEITAPRWLPDCAEVREELAHYYQAISRFDESVGMLVQALQDTGHDNDTLVIVISDNGSPFPGAKTTHYQPGINLPLVVRSPEQTKRGVVNDAAVSWVDLTPTILEFARVSVDVASQPQPANRYAPRRGELHGRSFLPALETEHPPGWDTVFCSFSVHDVTMYYPMRTLIRGHMKYIFNIAHPLPFPFAGDLYKSPTWQSVLDRGATLYGKRRVSAFLHRPRHELYDLSTDPDEIHNLADEPAHAATLTAMQEQLRDWQRRTKDPWIKKWAFE